MIGIQNYNVAKNERDLNNTVLTLRLNGAEASRFWRVMDAVKSRNPYIGKSDIIRELLGLNPQTALTSDELIFFRTGEKSQKPQADITDYTDSPPYSRGVPMIEISLESESKKKTG